MRMNFLNLRDRLPRQSHQVHLDAKINLAENFQIRISQKRVVRQNRTSQRIFKSADGKFGFAVFHRVEKLRKRPAFQRFDLAFKKKRIAAVS